MASVGPCMAPAVPREGPATPHAPPLAAKLAVDPPQDAPDSKAAPNEVHDLPPEATLGEVPATATAAPPPVSIADSAYAIATVDGKARACRLDVSPGGVTLLNVAVDGSCARTFIVDRPRCEDDPAGPNEPTRRIVQYRGLFYYQLALAFIVSWNSTLAVLGEIGPRTLLDLFNVPVLGEQMRNLCAKAYAQWRKFKDLDEARRAADPAAPPLNPQVELDGAFGVRVSVTDEHAFHEASTDRGIAGAAGNVLSDLNNLPTFVSGRALSREIPLGGATRAQETYGGYAVLLQDPEALIDDAKAAQVRIDLAEPDPACDRARRDFIAWLAGALRRYACALPPILPAPSSNASDAGDRVDLTKPNFVQILNDDETAHPGDLQTCTRLARLLEPFAAAAINAARCCRRCVSEPRAPMSFPPTIAPNASAITLTAGTDGYTYTTPAPCWACLGEGGVLQVDSVREEATASCCPTCTAHCIRKENGLRYSANTIAAPRRALYKLRKLEEQLDLADQRDMGKFGWPYTPEEIEAGRHLSEPDEETGASSFVEKPLVTARFGATRRISVNTFINNALRRLCEDAGFDLYTNLLHGHPSCRTIADLAALKSRILKGLDPKKASKESLQKLSELKGYEAAARQVPMPDKLPTFMQDQFPHRGDLDGLEVERIVDTDTRKTYVDADLVSAGVEQQHQLKRAGSVVVVLRGKMGDGKTHAVLKMLRKWVEDPTLLGFPANHVLRLVVLVNSQMHPSSILAETRWSNVFAGVNANKAKHHGRLRRWVSYQSLTEKQLASGYVPDALLVTTESLAKFIEWKNKRPAAQFDIAFFDEAHKLAGILANSGTLHEGNRQTKAVNAESALLSGTKVTFTVDADLTRKDINFYLRLAQQPFGGRGVGVNLREAISKLLTATPPNPAAAAAGDGAPGTSSARARDWKPVRIISYARGQSGCDIDESGARHVWIAKDSSEIAFRVAGALLYGLKVVVCSTSRKEFFDIEALVRSHPLLRHVRIASIHGAADGTDRELPRTPHRLADYDLVMYNTSLAQGTSIDTCELPGTTEPLGLVSFDVLFAIHSGRVGDINLVHQLAYRFRNLTYGKAFFFCRLATFGMGEGRDESEILEERCEDIAELQRQNTRVRAAGGRRIWSRGPEGDEPLHASQAAAVLKHQATRKAFESSTKASALVALDRRLVYAGGVGVLVCKDPFMEISKGDRAELARVASIYERRSLAWPLLGSRVLPPRYACEGGSRAEQIYKASESVTSAMQEHAEKKAAQAAFCAKKFCLEPAMLAAWNAVAYVRDRIKGREIWENLRLKLLTKRRSAEKTRVGDRGDRDPQMLAPGAKDRSYERYSAEVFLTAIRCPLFAALTAIASAGDEETLPDADADPAQLERAHALELISIAMKGVRVPLRGPRAEELARMVVECNLFDRHLRARIESAISVDKEAVANRFRDLAPEQRERFVPNWTTDTKAAYVVSALRKALSKSDLRREALELLIPTRPSPAVARALLADLERVASAAAGLDRAVELDQECRDAQLFSMMQQKQRTAIQLYAEAVPYTDADPLDTIRPLIAGALARASGGSMSQSEAARILDKLAEACRRGLQLTLPTPADAMTDEAAVGLVVSLRGRGFDVGSSFEEAALVRALRACAARAYACIGVPILSNSRAERLDREPLLPIDGIAAACASRWVESKIHMKVKERVYKGQETDWNPRLRFIARILSYFNVACIVRSATVAIVERAKQEYEAHLKAKRAEALEGAAQSRASAASAAAGDAEGVEDAMEEDGNAAAGDPDDAEERQDLADDDDDEGGDADDGNEGGAAAAQDDAAAPSPPPPENTKNDSEDAENPFVLCGSAAFTVFGDDFEYSVSTVERLVREAPEGTEVIDWTWTTGVGEQNTTSIRDEMALALATAATFRNRITSERMNAIEEDVRHLYGTVAGWYREAMASGDNACRIYPDSAGRPSVCVHVQKLWNWEFMGHTPISGATKSGFFLKEATWNGLAAVRQWQHNREDWSRANACIGDKPYVNRNVARKQTRFVAFPIAGFSLFNPPLCDEQSVPIQLPGSLPAGGAAVVRGAAREAKRGRESDAGAGDGENPAKCAKR